MRATTLKAYGLNQVSTTLCRYPIPSLANGQKIILRSGNPASPDRHSELEIATEKAGDAEGWFAYITTRNSITKHGIGYVTFPPTVEVFEHEKYRVQNSKGKWGCHWNDYLLIVPFGVEVKVQPTKGPGYILQFNEETTEVVDDKRI